MVGLVNPRRFKSSTAVSYTHLPCFLVDDRLMVVLENGLLLDGVLYAVLDLIRRLFRFEVHQTSGVLDVYKRQAP